MKIKAKGNKVLTNNFFAIKWLFKISPYYTFYCVFITIFHDVCVLIEHTFMVAYIVSCIENNRPLSDALMILVPITAIITIQIIIIPFIGAYVEPKINEKINKEIQLTLYQKAVKMDIDKYDNPEFYNDFVWAMREAPSHIRGALDDFIGLLSAIIITLLVGIYVIYSDAIGLIFIFITIAITFIARIKLNKQQIKRQQKIVPEQRKRDYINRVFYLSDYAKELRTSDIKEKLYMDYDKTSESMKIHIKKYGRKLTMLSYISNIFQKVLTFDGLYLSYLLYQTFYLNNFGYGTLIALYNSSSNLKQNIDRLIGSIPQFQNHSLYIKKLRTFLNSINDLNDDGNSMLPQAGDILLDNVSFSYPSSNECTLNEISMHIKKGEKIALVGYNGAGKSTLVKLIMRLYDPTSGNIYYRNLAINNYPLEEYRKCFGVVFQESELIAATLGENITMSTELINKSKAINVLKKTDLYNRYASFENDFNTQLTKEFDNEGVNLSGGESQKVTLSRALYSDPSILILDEPSSSLDPIAEYQINQTILNIAKDKTVIIITHRLSTTKFVDKIYMIENGKIIESGTHDELMKNNGKYAEMFNLQASKYR